MLKELRSGIRISSVGLIRRLLVQYYLDREELKKTYELLKEPPWLRKLDVVKVFDKGRTRSNGL